MRSSKADFPSADYVPPFTVFKSKGNRYRLIALIDDAEHVVVVRDVLTHATYSKGGEMAMTAQQYGNMPAECAPAVRDSHEA